MCGIVSVFSSSGRATRDVLVSGVSALTHRGPDGAGYWLANNGTVGLGHARLALVGGESGKQPIKNEDGSIIAVVNGEFYDHEIWVKKLIAKGHSFTTKSDSEILVHLYEEYGIECINKLNGEFAFLIWDSRKALLIAGRDRFGIKPLLWSEYEGQVFFASEAKSLFAMGVPAAWDHKSFFQMSSMQYIPTGDTLFSGVQQLPAGHLMLVNKNGIKQKCYWDLDLPKESDRSIFTCREEAVDKVKNSLSNSVKRRIRGNASVATQLSGGIDSSFVASLASQEGISKCFSIAFKDASEPYNERHLSEITAKELGLDLHVVALSLDDLAGSLCGAVEKSEGIAINAHLPAKYLLSKAMNDEGYSVALTGEGADELFLGYPHFQSDYANMFNASSENLYEQQASHGIMLPSGNELDTNCVHKLLGFVPCFLLAKAALGWKMRCLVKESVINERLFPDPFFSYLNSIAVSDQLSGRTEVNQSRYLWTKSALAGYILKTLGDGTEMAHSVEGRVPFLDHELYDIVKNIPHKWLLKPLEKQVLRDAAKGLVPETIRMRRKHPFVAPPAFLSPVFRNLAKEVFHDDCAKHHPFVDASSALKILERLPLLEGGEQVGWDAALMMALTSVLLGKTLNIKDII